MTALSIEGPSVQSLFVVTQRGDTTLTSGTAFVVSSGGRESLITNWHIAAGRDPVDGQPLSQRTGLTPDRMTVRHNGAVLGQWMDIDYQLRDENDAPLWREHPVAGRGVDVVALDVGQWAGVKTYPYDLDAETQLSHRVSEDVSIIGFPFGRSSFGGIGVWTRGSVASEPQLDFDGRPCFLVDSRTRGGQSGSPVINYSTGAGGHRVSTGLVLGGGPIAELLGVYSGRISAESDLGFVWKREALREVVVRGVTGNGELTDPRLGH